MDEPTPQERLQALITVHEQMLVSLWVSVLAEESDFVDAADDIANATLRRLEDRFDKASGRDATVTRELAVSRMEALWQLIRDDLVELAEPLSIQPTPYGLRLAEQLRKDRRSKGDPDEGAPPEEPDR